MFEFQKHLGVSKNSGKTPKMDGWFFIMENQPYEQMVGWFGGVKFLPPPIFWWKTTPISSNPLMKMIPLTSDALKVGWRFFFRYPQGR